jgi:hypothetical protein
MAGLQVLLLDREFDICQMPRAVHFDDARAILATVSAKPAD